MLIVKLHISFQHFCPTCFGETGTIAFQNKATLTLKKILFVHKIFLNLLKLGF